MKIKAAIFDLDGTLLDSMHIWDTLAEDYLLSVGAQPKAELREKLHAFTLREAAEYLKSEYSLPYTVAQILGNIIENVRSFYFNTASLKEGAFDFLKLLRHKQIKLCIATAGERELAEAALKRCGIFEFFDKIFTCAEIGHSKREPHIFLEALAFLNISPEEVLVFEDAYFAAKTAKELGFKVCGVFDKSENEAEALKALADFYITSFKEKGVYID